MPGTQTARVYLDAGSGNIVGPALRNALAATLGDENVAAIDAAGVLAGELDDGVGIFAMPGGADRPFADKLNGDGNARIRRWIERGGRFLGVCAGAYYACRRIDFTGATLRTRADRELALLPGSAVGSLPSLTPPFDEHDVACRIVTPLLTADGSPLGRAVYWGGPALVLDDDGDAEVLARYADAPPPLDLAAVRVRVGEGVAVLVGVHPELAMAANASTMVEGDATVWKLVMDSLLDRDDRSSSK